MSHGVIENFPPMSTCCVPTTTPFAKTTTATCMSSSPTIAHAMVCSLAEFATTNGSPPLTLHVLDLDGNEVSLLSGKTDILDTTVATIEGIRVIPKAPGVTVAGVRFGNVSSGMGVHVYERVSTLDALQEGKKFVGVSVRLAGGEVRSWSLPAGSWMLTMLPESDEANGVRLNIQGASCSPLLLSRRRYGCFVRTPGKVTLYNPSTSITAPKVTGVLLVRPLYN